MPKITLTIIAIALSIKLFSFPTHALEPAFNIATTQDIIETDFSDGDIVSLATESGRLTLTKKPGDDKMYGVVVLTPIVVYKTLVDGTPVVRAGEVLVNVTNLNGAIVVGDLVTSSEIPGKGQKATDVAGYMLGRAMESFDESQAAETDFNGKKVKSGKIKVAVGIGPSTLLSLKESGGLFGSLGRVALSLLTSIQTTKEAERLIRYLIAALVAIVTIYINFRSFGHNITKGIEALGRNPLARVSIQSMIILNIVLIAIVSVGGILLSLAIISL